MAGIVGSRSSTAHADGAHVRPRTTGNRQFPSVRWIAVPALAAVLAGGAVALGVGAITTPLTAPSGPQPTAEYQTPRGSNELAWSKAILKALGDPLTSANIVSIGYWMQNEAGHPPTGIVGANNPVNVSQPGYGGTPIQNEGGGYFLYSYPTVKDGIDATVAYLNRSTYGGIRAALKAGDGLSSPSLAQEFLAYSGHGYSTVPDSWGASQGKPET